MSQSSVHRNDPCPCGSGKKYKNCHLTRPGTMSNMPSEAQRTVSREMLRDIRRTVDECVVLYDYPNCVCWLFGISHLEVPNQVEMWEKLCDFREQFVEADNQADDPKKVVMFQRDPVELLRELQTIKKAGEENRDLWRNGLIRIICSDDEVRQLAVKVRTEGTVSLSKAEFDQRFDLSAMDPYWCHVPDYTQVFIGGSIGVSSPEYDMYRAMCDCYDRAVVSHRDRDEFQQRIRENADDQGLIRLDALNWKEWNNFAGVSLPKGREGVVHIWELGGLMTHLARLHGQEVRQVIIDACLFVEAFVNSVAHAYRCRPTRPLSPEQDLFLQERVIDKNTGKEREKYVALQDKLHQWIQIISPNGATFDKGGNPFQAFRTIQEYRDSIVHLSGAKVEKYRDIDLALATQAVDVAVEIARSICRFIASGPTAVSFPKWLVGRIADGLFQLAPSVKFFPEKEEAKAAP